MPCTQIKAGMKFRVYAYKYKPELRAEDQTGAGNYTITSDKEIDDTGFEFTISQSEY